MTSSIPAVNNAPLLDVRDLCVDFVNSSAVTHAVRGVSFQLGHEKLAIVGESGSGKSTVGRALLQLHPKKARVSASRMQFADLDLQHLSEAQMRGVRGKRISMIMQDPKYSLNPVVCVGKQIAEAWLTHHPGRKDEAKARALEMLEVLVGFVEEELSDRRHTLALLRQAPDASVVFVLDDEAPAAYRGAYGIAQHGQRALLETLHAEHGNGPVRFHGLRIYGFNLLFGSGYSTFC